MRISFLAALIFMIVGCAMPTTTVRSVDTRPSIAIRGVSSKAELLVDGLNMGRAGDYNGDPQTLTVEPGTHKISIIENGGILYEQTIFVESELKIITVR